MTKLTVCIPAYNAVDHVERAIRSIHLDEVGGPAEILVCDDGSTDDTWAVLQRLADEIPALRLIRHRRNLGRPRTRNELLQEATGTYLTWLDADDEKYPGMLRAQLDHLERVADDPDRSIDGVLAFATYHWLRQGWETPRTVAPIEPEDPMRSLLDASFGGYLWLMMGTRATFVAAGPFDEDLPRLQDLGFFIRFAELGGRFERVDSDDALCIYHKDDVGRDALAVWLSWNRIWRRYRHHYVSYGIANARRWRRHHYRVARRYAKANGDQLVFALVLGAEAAFVIRGRLRRLIFDA